MWRATEEPGPFDAIVRMLILTGQRREEADRMTWDELEADLSTWSSRQPGEERRHPHLCPCPLRRRRSCALRRPSGKSRRVSRRKGPFRLEQIQGSPRPAVRRLRLALHDFRRTVATGLQRLGVRLEVTEAVLNHVAGSRAGIVGVYQRHHWADEKRAALPPGASMSPRSSRVVRRPTT